MDICTDCACHVGGAYRPACSVPGGCGHLRHDDTAVYALAEQIFGAGAESPPPAPTPNPRQAGESGPRCGTRCARPLDATAAEDEGRLPGICPRCSRLTTRDLLSDKDGLLPLYLELHLRLAPGSGTGGRDINGDRRGTADDPVGIRPEVHDLMTKTVGTLSYAAEQIQLRRSLRGPSLAPLRRTGRFVASLPRLAAVDGRVQRIPAEIVRDSRPDRDLAASKVAALVDWIRPHHLWAVEQPWGVGYAEQIRDLAHEIRALCRLYDELPEWRAEVVCRECLLLTLFRHAGDDRLYCEAPGCNAVLTPAEYLEWSSLVAANPGRELRSRHRNLLASAAAIEDVKGLRPAARHLRHLAERREPTPAPVEPVDEDQDVPA